MEIRETPTWALYPRDLYHRPLYPAHVDASDSEFGKLLPCFSNGILSHGEPSEEVPQFLWLFSQPFLLERIQSIQLIRSPLLTYIMPAMPASSAPETPVTVSSRASARRAQGHAPEGSSPKTMFAQERFEQSVRTERRVIQEKFDAWDRDCERAFGYLYDAIPAEDRRRVARETTDDLQKMIELLTDHHKHRTIFDKLAVLLEFVQLSVDANLTIEQYVDCLLYTSPSPRDKRQSRMPSSA